MIDDFDLTQLVEPLQNWFKQNARMLPWRENPTGYYVWISEIMLQQTRVEAVKPYFDRFIRELPDVKALAECEEDKLLKLWEGLGYYNRVRNLKIAANQIMEEYDGEIPSDYRELLKLKGIGSYTAGAISSIAFGKPVPAVDGNVLRVISRVTADDSDIMKQSVRRHMEEKLFDLMNRKQEKNISLYEDASKGDFVNGATENCRNKGNIYEGKYQGHDFAEVVPSIFNQALMELGATVCVPNGAPHCELCPWGTLCEARKQNRIDELPVKKKGKARRIEERTVLIIKDGEQLALHKRPAKGLLAGLYELPNVEGHLDEAAILEILQEKGYEAVRIQPACEAKHIFSHVEWHMKGYVVFLSDRKFPQEDEQIKGLKDNKRKAEAAQAQAYSTEDADGTLLKEDMDRKYLEEQEWIFVDAEETKSNYAIPSAFARYAEYLNLILGKDAMK